MYNHDLIRSDLLTARKKLSGAAFDAKLVELMTNALVDARRTNDGTTSVLTSRYGFTSTEIEKHAQAAIDAATLRWRAGADTEAA